MQVTIVACTLFFGVAVAAVVPDEAQSETFGYENINGGSGNYRFSFTTSNGITREETGRLVNVGENNEYVIVEGSYSYTDPDGKFVIVKYTADENGYHIMDTVSPQVPSVAFGVPANVVASLLGK